jgi:hypothetical protein
MKKLLLFALVIPAVLFSCKDDETPSYKQADFIGNWEVTSSTIPDDDPNDCTTQAQQLEITATELIQTTICDGDPTSVTTSYTFDGKQTISYNLFGESKFVINSLNCTTFKITV